MVYPEVENRGIDKKIFDAIIHTNRACNYHNYMKTFVTALGPGEAEMTVEIEECHINPRRIVHGGVVFSLADTALGMVFRTIDLNAVTLGITLNYLAPIRDDEELTARAVIEHGKSKVVVGRVDVCNRKGEKVALARANFYVKGRFMEWFERTGGKE